MDGWNTSFLLEWPIFRGELLVSGANWCIGMPLSPSGSVPTSAGQIAGPAASPSPPPAPVEGGFSTYVGPVDPPFKKLNSFHCMAISLAALWYFGERLTGRQGWCMFMYFLTQWGAKESRILKITGLLVVNTKPTIFDYCWTVDHRYPWGFFRILRDSCGIIMDPWGMIRAS